jgi:hypothetical protein
VDIAAWLRSLGLEQYEPAFRENDVDAGVLPRLTSEDLKGACRKLFPTDGRAARERGTA